MISIGSEAPGFRLQDHRGHDVDFAALKGKCHVMLLFYPLDFTPT